MKVRGYWFVLLSSIGLMAGRAGAESNSTYYYVGEKKCRTCHAGHLPDSPFNAWRLSAHARAYSVLTLPVSYDIAKLSGVDVPPVKSPICWGCHTTGPTVEAWELDDGVHREDGIQCEACHGPGSAYIESETMKFGELGLIRPSAEDCMICHSEKVTHVEFLHTKSFDVEQGMKTIEHRGGEKQAGRLNVDPDRLVHPYYVGTWGCAQCHRTPELGDQYSVWRRSGHARAYAVLATAKGRAADSFTCPYAQSHTIPEIPQQAPECLKCHTTASGVSESRLGPLFNAEDGVQCETCHNPGSDYADESIMRDPAAAKKAGLAMSGDDKCRECHTHPEFDYEREWAKIAHPLGKYQHTVELVYKTPSNLCTNRDGSLLFIVCEDSNSLIVADTQSRKKIAEIAVGRLPHDVCLSPDETRAYITNRMSDSLSVIDLENMQTIADVPTGDEPHGVLMDASGRMLYVANYGTGDVSVIDSQTLQTVKRISAGRGTWSLACAPDHRQLYVTSNLSHFVGFREDNRSEVTVIDMESQRAVNRLMVPSVNLMQGIDFHPRGDYAVITLLRSKNLVPMTRIAQGWTKTNGLGIVWKDGRIDQVLLDEMNSYFADPMDVTVLPNGRFAYVTGGGVDAVAVVDLEKLIGLSAKCTDEEREAIIPNHLGKTVEYVLKRISVGINPRGIASSPDSRFVYVCNALDDTVSIIDTSKQEVTGAIDLEGPKEITIARLGNRIFHTASYTFQNQFSCHTCHPDGNVDGIVYDIEPDGIGRNPVDNRTLRGILDTAPFKWEGTNPSLKRQCGPRLSVFFTRVEPFPDDLLNALDYYICTIPRPPNRYRALGADLTDAQRRGKALFERTEDNIHRPIPKEQRCNYCHAGPYFTNRIRVDVETQSHLDDDGVFDVAHLNNIYDSPPFLHDGRAASLEEIWTRFNPNDRHGITNDMTKDQLNDLIEYLKTL